MTDTLVSIIMPTYNSERTVIDSIESIIRQTYESWELLITDDSSSDSTVSILNRYASLDSRIKVFELTSNSGAAVARNNSITLSSGRFIAFLDSDDIWSDTKLERQIEFMLENEYPFTYTYYQKISDKGFGGVVTSPSKIDYSGLLANNVVGCLTAIYDSRLLGKHFMPLIRKRQDLGLWLNLLRNTKYAYCLSEVLAYYRVDSGMTKNKFKVLKHQWSFYRDTLNLNFFYSCYLFSIYGFHGIKKFFL